MRLATFAAWRKRLNVRLHPLLAVGIGLGLLALVLPSAPETDRQSDEQILSRLLAPGGEADLSLLFWLRQRQLGSVLWGEARERCAEPAHASLPNCQSLATLERLAASRENQLSRPDAHLPTEPGGTP